MLLLLKIFAVLFSLFAVAWLIACVITYNKMREYLGVHVIFRHDTFLKNAASFLLLPTWCIVTSLRLPEGFELLGETLLSFFIHAHAMIDDPYKGWAELKGHLDELWQLRATTKMDNGILYTKIGRGWRYGEWRQASPALNAEFHRGFEDGADWDPDEFEKMVIADHKRPR